jgi:DNA replication protein DnaC
MLNPVVRDPQLYCPFNQRKIITDWIQEYKTSPIPKELEAKVGRNEIPCPSCVESPKAIYASPSTGKWFSVESSCKCKKLKYFYERFDSSVGEKYRDISLLSLQPSDKSVLSLARQGKLLEKLRSNPEGSYAFFGPSGTSKTTFLIALFRRALAADTEVIFKNPGADIPATVFRVNIKRLMDNFVSEAINAEGRLPLEISAEKIRKLAAKGYKTHLFLEEFDKVRYSEFKANCIFELLDTLYENDGQLVLTSNFSKDKFSNLFGEVIGPTILRRITEMCKVSNFFPKE